MKFVTARFLYRLHLSRLDNSKAVLHEKEDHPTDVFLELTLHRIFDIKDVLGTKLSMRLFGLLRDPMTLRNVCTSSTSSGS